MNARTSVRAARTSRVVGALGAAAVTGCFGGCKGEPTLQLSAPPDTTVDSAVDAALPVVVTDASAPGTDGSTSAVRLAPCGDVPVATSHAPFAAIKKLATTTDPVRILVYGQSIALQPWWTQVRDWLKKTYPNGNLVMESHGRGSCSSECLVGRDAWFTDNLTQNRLPDDVYPWNPDLILFNVYGGEEDYTYIAHGFVEGCSAFDKHPVATAHCKAGVSFPNYRRPEVLLQTDHRLPGTYPVVDANLKAHNEVFLPGLAKTLAVSYGDVWTKWGAWLDTHEKDASAYLQDGLHLNDKGNVLMASLVEQDLCYNPLP